MSGNHVDSVFYAYSICAHIVGLRKHPNNAPDNDSLVLVLPYEHVDNLDFFCDDSIKLKLITIHSLRDSPMLHRSIIKIVQAGAVMPASLYIAAALLLIFE